MSRVCEYRSSFLERIDDILTYEFTQIGGEEDFNLMLVVFEEYINQPILLCLRGGQPIIKTSGPPVLDGVVETGFQSHSDKHMIRFYIKSGLLLNEIVSEEEKDKVGDSGRLYVKLLSGEYLSLCSVSPQNLGSLMALLFVVRWLDGMSPKVDGDEYLVRCKNCVFNEKHIGFYLPVLEEEMKHYFSIKTGCVLEREEYGETGEGCGLFFVRATNPDMGDITAVLKDVFNQHNN